MSRRDAVALLVMVAGVYLPKLLPLLLVGRDLPPGVRRWLGYVAPAALSALVAPAVLGAAGIGTGAPPNPWHVAGYALAGVVALLTRRVLVAVALGMAVVLAGAALGA